LADISRLHAGYGPAVRIHIDFEAIDPPQGLIGGEGAEPPIHFDGWLGLVTSLEGLLAGKSDADKGEEG
jgi:hypothetical protein